MASSGSSSETVKRTLHIASLLPWMDKAYLGEVCFPDFKKHITGVKFVSQKHCNRYAFIEFTSGEIAEEVLKKYQNKNMPRTELKFALNWRKKPPQSTNTSQGAAYPSTHPEDADPVRPLASSSSLKKPNHTLYISGLKRWMREDYLRNCFGDFSSQIRKVNFDVSKVTLKHTHAYLEFATPEVAGMVLHSFHNKIMPKTNNIWRFNLEWARWQPRVKVKQSSSAGSKILCINNLGEGMGEDFIRDVFPSHLQSHVTLFEKPRPPSAMIEFSSHDVAASALERYTEESVCRKFSLTWCPTEQPGPSLPTNLLKRKRE